MMAEALRRVIGTAIAKATGQDFTLQSMDPCGGGCINQASLVHGGDQSYFVKYNRDANAASMFAAEARCLTIMADTRTLRVPQPITQGEANGVAFLVLEAIHFGRAPRDWAPMGEQLAALHHKVNDRHGWDQDNFIGATPQHNAWAEDWATFYREQRLRPQLQWASERGRTIRDGEALLNKVHELLDGHTPAPSLLHGDLWGGNAGHDLQGHPVLYDPASYYGDRETDLAFTELFGGFPHSFYAAYERAWPLPQGHDQRKPLYNLYHVINHANLFGGSYYAQAEQTIQQLLSM